MLTLKRCLEKTLMNSLRIANGTLKVWTRCLNSLKDPRVLSRVPLKWVNSRILKSFIFKELKLKETNNRPISK